MNFRDMPASAKRAVIGEIFIAAVIAVLLFRSDPYQIAASQLETPVAQESVGGVPFHWPTHVSGVLGENNTPTIAVYAWGTKESGLIGVSLLERGGAYIVSRIWFAGRDNKISPSS